MSKMGVLLVNHIHQTVRDVVVSAMGKAEKAICFLETAQLHATDLKDLFAIYNHLGNAYESIQNFEKAIYYYERMLKEGH